MRDRLIELLFNAKCDGENCLGSCPYRVGDKCDKVTRLSMCSMFSIVDHLLASGVIVPPCKVGQPIWHITRHYDGRNELREGKVSMLQQKADKSWKIRISVRSIVWDFTPSEIGQTYFLTREEAEKALEERGEQ